MQMPRQTRSHVRAEGSEGCRGYVTILSSFLVALTFLLPVHFTIIDDITRCQRRLQYLQQNVNRVRHHSRPTVCARCL